MFVTDASLVDRCVWHLSYSMQWRTSCAATAHPGKGTRMALKAIPTHLELDAAREYVALQSRSTHPVGRFDAGGRWFPTVPCRCAVRAPSRSYPYSLLVHMRTAQHVAEVRGMTRARLLAAARTISATAPDADRTGGGA